MSAFIKGMDMVSLGEFDDEQLGEILSFAHELKARSASGEELDLLSGVQLFLHDPDHVMPAWDPFRLAMAQLGGQALVVDPERIHLAWDETYLDLFRQLDLTGHGLAMASIRPGEGHDFIEDAAALLERPVLNMLSERAAPFQSLASLMTVEERAGARFLGEAAVCWAPPGMSPKPASLPLSLVEALLRRGMGVRLACPPDFHPGLEHLEFLDARVPGALQQIDDPDAAVEGADLVFSLGWAAASSLDELEEMGERAQVHESWRLTRERFSLANPEALLGGGMPQSRGREIEEALLEDARAMHLDESANLLHVAKSVCALTLDLCLEHRTENESIQ